MEIKNMEKTKKYKPKREPHHRMPDGKKVVC